MEGNRKCSGTSQDVPVQAALGNVVLINRLLTTDNPWLNVSLNIWKKVVKLCNLKDSMILLRWCAYDTEFVPEKNR